MRTPLERGLVDGEQVRSGVGEHPRFGVLVPSTSIAMKASIMSNVCPEQTPPTPDQDNG